MADDIKQRLTALETQLEESLEAQLIKDSMILEYRQALDEAHYKIAMLNGQAKVKDRQILKLLADHDSSEPTA